ncbi:MAG: hypothetical protein ACKOZW_12295 [Cyanobium sp.]
MPVAAALVELDVLVYSAHKTGTQTLVHTLRDNGVACAHCHRLTNLQPPLSPELLPECLQEYRRQRGRPLTVVSVFREPIGRHISSFFQWHGEGVLRRQPGGTPADSLLARAPVPDLQRRFQEDLERGAPVGALESIRELCGALAVPLEHLHFDQLRQYGMSALPDANLHLFRFDSLIEEGRIGALLAPLVGRPLESRAANLSAAKWYFQILQEFRATLRLPAALIRRIHAEKADLLELMYGDRAADLLTRTLERYGDGAN